MSACHGRWTSPDSPLLCFSYKKKKHRDVLNWTFQYWKKEKVLVRLESSGRWYISWHLTCVLPFVSWIQMLYQRTVSDRDTVCRAGLCPGNPLFLELSQQASHVFHITSRRRWRWSFVSVYFYFISIWIISIYFVPYISFGMRALKSLRFEAEVSLGTHVLSEFQLELPKLIFCTLI